MKFIAIILLSIALADTIDEAFMIGTGLTLLLIAL